MAIDPSAVYPGQVATGDPGYPLGKARNEISDGDGTGTPLEALWVMDLWGWQQALLDAAGITPSGDPDEVGASDYLDALNALYPAIGRMTTAEADIDALDARLDVAEPKITTLEGKFPASTDHAAARYNGTTGTLQDSPVIIDDAGAVSGVTTLTASDVVYTSPPTRVVYVDAADLSRDTVLAGTSPGWASNQVTPDSVFGTIQSMQKDVRAHLRLNDYVPAGATLTRCRVLVKPIGAQAVLGDRMFISIQQYTVSGTTITQSVLASLPLSARDDGTTAKQWLDSGVVSLAYFAAGSFAKLHVSASESASGDQVFVVELTFTDPGPRNY